MISQESLKCFLDYDPLLGVFTRVVGVRRFKKGSRAGCINKKGYRVITINHIPYYEHRLAFLYMDGKFPEGQVDHINRIKDDNRWDNLKKVTNRENSLNRGTQSNNSTGVKGVSLCKKSGKFHAYISIDGKRKSLGYYETLEKATTVRNNSEKVNGYNRPYELQLINT